MKSSFIPFDERLRLINEVIKPAYGKVGRKLTVRTSFGGPDRVEVNGVAVTRQYPDISPEASVVDF